jgi:hypothetical protein
MRHWIAVIAIVCVMAFFFVGCANHGTPSAGHGQYECGPEGCPIPDAYGRIHPPPTTMPQTPMSPIR